MEENLITILQPIDQSKFDPLLEILTKMKVYINHHRTNSGRGRSQCFGIGYIRCIGAGTFANNFHYPELYKRLINFGKEQVPFVFDGIQLNNNYQCLPHKDKNNILESFLVGFGDYTGGEINIKISEDQTEKIDTKLQPILFDGSLLEHWNDPIQGNKYSLVYFRNREAQAARKFDQVDYFDEKGKKYKTKEIAT